MMNYCFEDIAKFSCIINFSGCIRVPLIIPWMQIEHFSAVDADERTVSEKQTLIARIESFKRICT